VNWWDKALFDTCSLITLDKINLDHPEIMKHFETVRVIEPSLSSDNLYLATAERLRKFVHPIELPSVTVIAEILQHAQLSCSIAQVDQLIYAVAIHGSYAVVTADKDLAETMIKKGLHVGNMAIILHELFLDNKLKENQCNTIINDLAKRSDYILPPHDLSCHALKKFRFP
jgi:predicted nuclease of predicted toxin-antitoxin system